MNRPEAQRSGRPDISLVIVSWNVRQLLHECIDSVSGSANGMSFEIIVVDNASTDQTVDLLRQRFPWVQVLANNANAGFAGGCNQGYHASHGRYVFFLNPDTRLLGDAMFKLVDFLDNHPDVGAVGPRLTFLSGETQSVSARLLFTVSAALWCESLRLNSLPALGPALTRKLLCPYDYNTTQAVEAISGAAMVVRKDLLDQLGGFDESFIHCGEDLDLCRRITTTGSSVYYLSDADVLHHSGRSSVQAPVRTAVNRALSDQLFIRKTFGAWKAHLYRVVVQGVQVPAMALIGFAKVCVGNETLEQLKYRLRVAGGLLRWSKME